MTQNVGTVDDGEVGDQVCVYLWSRGLRFKELSDFRTISRVLIDKIFGEVTSWSPEGS